MHDWPVPLDFSFRVRDDYDRDHIISKQSVSVKSTICVKHPTNDPILYLSVKVDFPNYWDDGTNGNRILATSVKYMYDNIGRYVVGRRGEKKLSLKVGHPNPT